MRKAIYLYIICVVLLLSGCGGGQMPKELQAVSEIINDYPDSALVLLDSMEAEKATWNKDTRMRYDLLRMKAQNKLYINFSNDSLPRVLVDYFDRNGSDNDRLLARYLLGRTYSDIGDAPLALQTYYEAIEQVDTLNPDCDFNTLMGVYGQMSRIFHKQNLPHNEIWALHHYIDCIKRTESEEEVIIAKNQLVRPYYLLGEKDTVLQIINDTYHSLLKIGKRREAADAVVVSIYLYLERGELEKARQMKEIFETESGLFDEQGNIAPGRESYYCSMGYYELKTHHIDSAEKYYRKAIQYGYFPEAYKGLLRVYQERHNADSVMRYALLFEAAQDSLHNQMRTDAIHQMSALYDYTRSQRQAELEAAKARTAKQWTSVVVVCLIVLIIIFGAYINLHRRRQELMALRIRQLEEFKLAYEKTEESERNQTEQSIRQTPIYQRLAMMKETDHPTDEDWQSLTDTINEAYPQFTARLFSLCRISPHEHHVCLLLKAGFDPVSIATLTLRSKAAISVVRSRLYEKAFGKKGSAKDWDEVIKTL